MAGLAVEGVTVTPTLRDRANAAVPTLSAVATSMAANRLAEMGISLTVASGCPSRNQALVKSALRTGSTAAAQGAQASMNPGGQSRCQDSSSTRSVNRQPSAVRR